MMMAPIRPITMKQTRAIKYLLFCCSSETKAVSTFTSTMDVRANKVVCFREMASPITRMPSKTPTSPD